MDIDLTHFSDEELAALAWSKQWYEGKARSSQIAPKGDWSKWLVLAGRGFGKTLVGGYWIGIEAWARPNTFGHVIAPTWSDVINTCFEGPSGILSHMPPELIANWSVSEAILELNNGTKLRGFSAEKPDRLRGPQCHYLWGDEVAAWQHLEDTYDMAMFGLRLGDHIKALFTTTPKPKPKIVELIREAEAEQSKPPRERKTIITRGSTYENRANLAKNFFDDLVKQYEGTTLGRQELYAEVIDPEEQGIIKKSWFKLWPADQKLPALRYIVLSLDTAFTEAARDKKTGDTDPTAGTVWGIFEHPKEPGRDCVLLLDAWQEHLGFPDLLKKVREELKVSYGEQQEPAIKSPFGRAAIKIAGGRKPDILIIEEKGSGISLKQALARESIEAYGYNPGRASKLERLHAVAHFFANGIIYIPESPKRPEKPVTWAEDMIQQLCTFSGEGSIKHDDYVDSATQAIRFLTDKHWVTLKPRAPRDEAAAAHKPPVLNPYKR
jgi:predicted phage terminase large subunit-like protein